MKRRTFLGSALTSLVAGLVPASALSQAVALHNVIIDIDKDKKATMTIDGGDKVSLNSMVLRINVYTPAVKVMFEDDGMPRMDLKHPDEKWA